MRTALCLSLLALAGCSALGPSGGLDIEADPPTLVLDNEAGQTVYYVAIESEAATRADLKPDVTAWPSIAAGRTLRIAYEDLDGYEEGDTEVVVFWSMGEGYTQERVLL